MAAGTAGLPGVNPNGAVTAGATAAPAGLTGVVPNGAAGVLGLAGVEKLNP